MAYYAAMVPPEPAVVKAIEEVREIFAGHLVDVRPDGQGGAYVVVHKLRLGEVYSQAESWLGFHITYLYPAADVYPHYVRPDLTRRDGQPLGPGFAQATWAYVGGAVIQISRRSNRRDANHDTAALKAIRVVDWLRNPH
jgi:hypothetical protein